VWALAWRTAAALAWAALSLDADILWGLLAPVTMPVTYVWCRTYERLKCSG
jgi:hypothetical protein